MTGQILGAADLTSNVEIDAQVCIIGSGAGGAVLAAGLAARGIDVVMLEAGGHYTRDQFKGDEAWSFDRMYQERGARATEDLAVTVLQGRSVGGSTTVNWTTCYRTPDRVLQHWADVHGVQGLGPDDLRPHFESVERRLNIHEWPEAAANPNNQVLLRGGRALGWDPHPLRRNVRGCMNSGYCGVGCPVDAKQGMGVSYLQDAVRDGLRIYSNVEATRIEWADGRAQVVHGKVLDPDSDVPTGVSVAVRPKVLVSAGGAINGPALFIRSGIEWNGLVGKRTFIHPVSGIAGLYEQRTDPWYGAPQSVGCHHFNVRGPDQMGYFLESAPLQPMLASTVGSQFGTEHAAFMEKLGHVGVLIAIGIDGFLPEDVGGTVKVKRDGRVWLDYPIRPLLVEALKDAHLNMARCHFAAGALEMVSLHTDPVRLKSEADLPRLAAAPYGAHKHTMFTAHVMGGCTMGGDPATSVVDHEHRMRGFENVFVVDGSVLPTSLGVNPSQTIYGVAHRARQFVAAAV
jgi:choline dehydrogenase-like flavoprotein